MVRQTTIKQLVPTPKSRLAADGLTWVLLITFSSQINAQYGDFKYCCDIQKCLDVVRHCSAQSLCRERCLSNTTEFPRDCNPPTTLHNQDYSCFEPYLDPNTTRIGQKCGQTYDEGLAPASPFYITFGECKRNCSGWDLSQPSASSGPITLLMQYLAPIVIFCVTIPRRQRWEAPTRLVRCVDNFVLRTVLFLPALIISVFIVTADVTVWIFFVIAFAGPIHVGGITELVLDFLILRRLTGEGHQSRELRIDERVELLAAVLCGNLDRGIGQPADRIQDALRVETGSRSRRETAERLEATKKQLQSILRSQSTFGSLVGAPVLFFLGPFVVVLEGLSSNIGDNLTAHSLAFGMWWMVIVLITIVSSCTLASNNPSTVSSIVAGAEQGQRRRQSSVSGAGRTFSLGMRPLYTSEFMPVSLWNRGRMKKRWIEETQTWHGRPADQRRLELEKSSIWIAIPLLSLALVAVPTVLAIVISYTTPKVCVGCRTLTFLVYVASQMVLIVANTVRTHYSTVGGRFSRSGGVAKTYATLWRNLHGLARTTLWIFALGLVVVAGFASVVTVFVGTISQLLGVYGSCECSISVGEWTSSRRESALLNIATDTALHRDMSRFWSGTGYAAIVSLALVTYGGWNYQRWLRRRCEDEIQRMHL